MSLNKAPVMDLRRSLVLSEGDWTIFVTSPISLLFLVLSAIALTWPSLRRMYERKIDERMKGSRV